MWDIIVNQKNGTSVTWKKGQYTEYTYVDHCFVMIKNGVWIAIYNMDCVDSIYVNYKEK